jgi:DNA-binding transcriptional LysR family regulator
MKLAQLFTFLEVARLGSFRKASERLNTTQPAVSARIATLEETLGVRLFEREGARVTLTLKGRELRPYAERMVRLAEETRTTIGEDTHLSGRLRIGVSETLVHAWLPAFLSRLNEQYPQIDLDISVDVSVIMRDALVDQRLDLAFLMGPVSEYSIRNLELCRYPLIWVAAPELVGQADLRGDGLFAHTLLTYARNTRPYSELVEYCRQIGVDHPRLFASSSLSAVRQMALQGIGVGSVPAFFVQSDLAEGRLVQLDTKWCPSALTFTASYADQPQTAMLESVATLAQAVAASLPNTDKT